MSEKTAADVMSTDVSTISADQTLGEMIQSIARHHFSGLPVVDHDNRAIGMVTQNDVLKSLAATDDQSGSLADFLGRSVGSVMSHDAHGCSPGTSVSEIAQTLDRLAIHRLVVVDQAGGLVGLVSSTDLVRASA